MTPSGNVTRQRTRKLRAACTSCHPGSALRGALTRANRRAAWSSAPGARDLARSRGRVEAFRGSLHAASNSASVATASFTQAFWALAPPRRPPSGVSFAGPWVVEIELLGGLPCRAAFRDAPSRGREAAGASAREVSPAFDRWALPRGSQPSGQANCPTSADPPGPRAAPGYDPRRPTPQSTERAAAKRLVPCGRRHAGPRGARIRGPRWRMGEARARDTIGRETPQQVDEAGSRTNALIVATPGSRASRPKTRVEVPRPS